MCRLIWYLTRKRYPLRRIWYREALQNAHDVIENKFSKIQQIMKIVRSLPGTIDATKFPFHKIQNLLYWCDLRHFLLLVNYKLTNFSTLTFAARAIFRKLHQTVLGVPLLAMWVNPMTAQTIFLMQQPPKHFPSPPIDTQMQGNVEIALSMIGKVTKQNMKIISNIETNFYCGHN